MIRTLIAAIVLVLTASTFGCAGSPEVPDEPQKRSYKSTEEGEGESTPEQSADAKPANKPVSQDPIKATGPVATVDGEEIPAAEFNKEIERIIASGLPPAMLGQVSSKIVEKLVDRYLIDAEIAEKDVEVSDEEIGEKMEEVRQQFAKASEQFGNQASLEAITKQLGISKEELRDSIEQSIAIEKLLEKRGLETPSDDKVKEFYEDNKAQFERPEEVHARHILVQVERGSDDAAWDAAKKKAEMIRKEAVAEGADFAELAKKKSEGPSAKQGGDLGFFPRGRMVPEFEEVAFSLKPGDVSEPVRTQFGWHVIKVVDRHEAGPVPFEEVSEELAAQMKNKAVQEALVGFLEELRKDATIEIHEDNIQ
jgi:peptidyl-prolyl cis-trans isomerase C